MRTAPRPCKSESALADGKDGKASLTPIVTPAAPIARAPHLYPLRQPLVSAGGPTAGVQKLVLDALKAAMEATTAPPTTAASGSGSSAEPSSDSSAGGRRPLSDADAQGFDRALRLALEDPNLIGAKAAHDTLASGFAALLTFWPPADQRHFGLLYLMRLLAAASDVFGSALLDAGVEALLQSPASGALGGKFDDASAPVAGARGARLMSLALLSNLAAKPGLARRLLCGKSAAGIVAAAARALGTASDAAVAQMGAALSLNLTLCVCQIGPTPGGAGDGDDDEDCVDNGKEAELVAALGAAAEEVVPPLLTATLQALPALTNDAEGFSRTLSCVGHLLAREDADDALCVAVSLDAATTLDGLVEHATRLGHCDLLREVRALLG